MKRSLVAICFAAALGAFLPPEARSQPQLSSRLFADFNEPHGMAVDANGNVYVVDLNNDRVQKFDANGNFVTLWGFLGTADGAFRNATGIAVDAARNVCVSYAGEGRIVKTDSTGTYLSRLRPVSDRHRAEAARS